MKVVFQRKLARFGGSYRITIPKEIVDALSLKTGETLNISLRESGVIEMERKRIDGLRRAPKQ